MSIAVNAAGASAASASIVRDTVVGALGVAVAGVLTNWFGLSGPSQAHLSIVVFNVTSTYDQPGQAQVTIQNTGGSTAASCVATWLPGIEFKATNTRQAVTSTEFALDPGREMTLSFRTIPYPFLGVTTTSVSVLRRGGVTASDSKQIYA